MEHGNDKHRLLIENLPDAFAYHQMVTDSEGEPVDYIFLIRSLWVAGMRLLPTATNRDILR